MKKSYYVPILVSVLLSACSSETTHKIHLRLIIVSLLNIKAWLKYTTSISSDAVLGNPAATRQQSFVSPTRGSDT